MTNQIAFTERVRNTLIQCAVSYKSYFVDYEYLICSAAFRRSKFYIVDAHEDNYQHLTGISSSLSKNEFFSRCYHGTLQESDFSFVKQGQTEKAVKGTVRRKMKALPNIINFFSCAVQVEEDFQKNRIRCSFAAGSSKCTLGFSISGKTRPMTLLSGDELDHSKSGAIDLVFRKKNGAAKFDDLICGDQEAIKQYYPYIGDLIDKKFSPDRIEK